MIRACREKIVEGMNILTNSEKVEDRIRHILGKKLENHVLSCPSCPVQGHCSFESLLQRYNYSFMDLNEDGRKIYLENQTNLFLNTEKKLVSNESIVYDHSKCLTCYRCIRACEYVQGMSKSSLVLETEGGKSTKIFKDLEDYHENMFSSDCIRCGMCSFVCPVGAITENSKLDELMKLIRTRKEEGKIVVAQMAPSVRVTLSEYFKLAPGAFKENCIVTGLKEIGFDYCFDTTFAADLCIMEEGTELLGRMNKGGPFPMYTSCCPGWINMVELHYPELIPNLSSCKSPQAMLGAIIKTFWAEKMGFKKDNIVVVSLMPCVAKKSENIRDGISTDIDYTLTTREVGRMFEKSNFDICNERRETPWDDPLGTSSSAGIIFGATGGVMEAAIRTAYELATGKEFPALNFTQVRGLSGIKTANVKINEKKLKVAVVSGGLNMRRFLRKLKYDDEQSIGDNYSPYFVEFMACPGGCIGGAGNPKFGSKNLLKERMEAIYSFDDIKNGKRKIRKSHENPKIKELYENFFGKPCSELSKKLLHTKYKSRKVVSLMEDDL